MTQSDDAGSDRDGRTAAVGPPWWNNPKLQRERLVTQVQLIVDSLPGVGVYPPSAGSAGYADMRFMYRKGVILVRDEDLERVRRVLASGGGGGRLEQVRRVIGAAAGRVGGNDDNVDDAMIAGITAVRVPDTIEALEIVDARLGVGVATPDHVFYVTPAACCPATEPDPTDRATPYPPVSDDPDCDGVGVLALVVDTGFIPQLVNAAHPWLSGVTGEPETFDPANVGRYTGHGTFVAGVLRSMAPLAAVEVKGFLRLGGAAFESKIIAGLHRALDLTPDIISMSAGATTRHDLPALGFQVLWERRLRELKGTVLIAAAGNDGDRGPFWPATFPWAIAVGALDDTGQRAGYSNFGSWVDVYALGSDIINAFPAGHYVYAEPPRLHETVDFDREMAVWSGTSFATPLVAGLVAARVSRTGESGRAAAAALLRIGRRHHRLHVGPVLEPGMACLEDLCCCHPESGAE